MVGLEALSMEAGSTSVLRLVLGLAAGVAPWVFIAAAIIVSGCFSFLENALSDLGDWAAACGGDAACLSSCNRLSEPLFNYGLVASGVLIVLYSLALGAPGRVYAFLLLLSGVFLLLVGVFPEHARPWHVLSAFLFFLSAPTAVLLSGLRGPVPLPLAAGLAALSYTGLALTIASKMGVLGIGMAVPEIIVAAPASAWLIYTALRPGS